MSGKENPSVPPGHTRLSLILADDVVAAIKGIQAYQGLDTLDQVIQRAMSWYDHANEVHLMGGQFFVREKDGKFYRYTGDDGVFSGKFEATTRPPRRWWHRLLP